jgi:hypothetical protein
MILHLRQSELKHFTPFHIGLYAFLIHLIIILIFSVTPQDEIDVAQLYDCIHDQ